MRLENLTNPKLFKSYKAFGDAVEKGDAIIPCASAVRRTEVGGLPERIAVPVDVAAPAAELVGDARFSWLVAQVSEWAAKGEKCLVFVRDLERLEALVPLLEAICSRGVGNNLLLQPLLWQTCCKTSRTATRDSKSW